MKTFFITLAVFFICLLQGLMSSKVESDSKSTSSAGWMRCGYGGHRPCNRGYFYRHGSRYWGYPYGFGYRGCYRRCYRSGYCC